PAATPTGPPPLPPEWEPPPVKHVFMIVLGDHGYEEAFGATSTAPYLAHNLRPQGELLPNYYAVAQGDLANEIALISGQGPTLETVANCPNYTDISPGTVSLEEEQVEGNGCVYPAETQTLPGQLAAQALSWKAYVEGTETGPEHATSCRHPALGGPDPAQAPLPGDAYETWRNPFVYFHSLTDGAECTEGDLDFSRLAPDLKKAETTPTVSYIVADACHDGSELPCEPGQPAGLVGAEPFLKTVVPEIKSSPAYKEGGLIAITFAQAPQAGPTADPAACCATPEYPNLPPVAPAPETTTTESTTPVTGSVVPTGGGGRVGLLLISPFVKKGSTNGTAYNHFSLLASIEALFGFEPIGYAANPAMTVFDETVYNAPEEAPAKAARRALLDLLGRAG
ncbi:MAG TPA: alkaline phosphatase family protein, partial [Solirubrobacterales bacterium]